MTTTSARDWLNYARVCGYDTGFVHTPNPELLALERLGLVERNQNSNPVQPQWRVTEKGGAFDELVDDDPIEDAQAETERQFFEFRKVALELRAERDDLKLRLELVTRERDHLKAAYTLARCSWCDEPVCEKHAAPGDHPGCGGS